jgi:hypothetical protein
VWGAGGAIGLTIVLACIVGVVALVVVLVL